MGLKATRPLAIPDKPGSAVAIANTTRSILGVLLEMTAVKAVFQTDRTTCRLSRKPREKCFSLQLSTRYGVLQDMTSVSLRFSTGGYDTVPPGAHATYRSCPPLPCPSRGCRSGSSFPQLWAAACLLPQPTPLQHCQLAADTQWEEVA